jgi:EAL domain-containing protein (putative c-di-GMP-specific phosphodiesterase class I)
VSVIVDAGNDVLVADLLRRGFHSVVFQPIRALDGGGVFGFEALMRGPEGTPLAEPSKIFRDGMLDRALLHRLDIACFSSALRLGRLAAEEHALFVNIHGETLLRAVNGTDDVRRLLDAVGVSPSRLVIEVSEMTDRSHVRAIARSLRPLRMLGVRVALDDVGARYAWLHHMMWIEPDFLKLDRSVVRGAAASPRRRDMVGGVVAFARGSGSDVIAEGIERENERDVMREAGVLLGQGFLLGRPAPAQEWFPAEGRRAAGLVE